MKNSKIKINKQEDPALTVLAQFDNFSLLENLVEKLSHRRYDGLFIAQEVVPGWEVIDTSCVEAYVSGNLFISENDKCISMPFTTCFSFTCARGIDGADHLTWSSSLS